MTQNHTPRYEGRRVTREEYLNLPDDGYQYDMIEGVLHMSPSPFFEHNEILIKVASLFMIHLQWGSLGKCAVETDLYLPDGGDVLRPDLSLVLKENLDIIAGHIHGTPDLISEVLSEATRDRDLGIKAGRYLANGVKEYWIFNPADKSMQVWFNRSSYWDKKTGDVLSSELLSGLEISVQDIYGGIS